jgi:hypothetical protein
LFSLVYVSTAVTWFSPTELRSLLASARAANERAGITGMLLYQDGNFMQALEGDEAVVLALRRRIEVDRRHQGVLTLTSGPAREREFGQWSMAYFDLGAAGSEPPAGYSHFLDRPLTDPAFLHDPGCCRRLLAAFRELQ